MGPGSDLGTMFRLCGNQVYLGTVTPPVNTSYAVRRSFTSFDGETVRCGDASNDCQVAVVGPGGQPFSGVLIDMRLDPTVPLEVTASPSEGLLPNAVVTVEVTGTREERFPVALCDASVNESHHLEPGPCTGPGGCRPGRGRPRPRSG